MPLTKNMVLISFPVTTSSFTHSAGESIMGIDNVAPNIVK